MFSIQNCSHFPDLNCVQSCVIIHHVVIIESLLSDNNVQYRSGICQDLIIYILGGIFENKLMLKNKINSVFLPPAKSVASGKYLICSTFSLQLTLFTILPPATLLLVVSSLSQRQWKTKQTRSDLSQLTIRHQRDYITTIYLVNISGGSSTIE